MGNIYEVKNSGEILLNKFSTNPTPAEGMLIYNCTDKKLRYYDGTSWKDTGESTTKWWNDTAQYCVFEDFTASDGTCFCSTRWCFATSGTGDAYARIYGNIGRVCAVATATVAWKCAWSCGIPQCKSVYLELKCVFETASGQTDKCWSVFVNGTEIIGNATCLSSVGGDTIVGKNQPIGLLVEWVGNNCYKVYTGSYLVATLTSTTCVCVGAYVCTRAYDSGTYTECLGIDNVRYKC
jgi:hypothetical protein